MTGRELRERHEAYAQASGTEAAWDLLADSIEADLCERVVQVIERREGPGVKPDMTGDGKLSGLESDEAVQARRAQAFDPEG